MAAFVFERTPGHPTTTKTSAMAQQQAIVELFYEPDSHTMTYVVVCPETKKCAIIDPVYNFDFPSFSFSSGQSDEILARLKEKGWECEYVLETHAHADHITSSAYLKKKTGAKVCIGEGICDVQKTFRAKFNADFPVDGSQFDHLWTDGEEFKIGNLSCQAIWTPGHTPDSISYYIKYVFRDDCLFAGDTLFMPDSGTARCDFPNGSAKTLWESSQKILSLPPSTRFFVCHDYQPGGREMRHCSTVAEQKEANKHVSKGRKEEDFIKMRTERDATLKAPRLLFPSVFINILAGNLPEAEDNGVHYFKFPISMK